MLLLNFSHPLTAEHVAQVERVTGQPVEGMVEVSVHLDLARPLEGQVAALVDGVGLAPVDWQTQALVVNPPGHAPATCVLLAELHGRMGYFPTILWLRLVADSTPPRFEVADVVNLQALRDAARRRR